MSIHARVLGQPGRDNAAYATVHTHNGLARFLFDCGDATITDLPVAEIQAIDHLCFSHLHMDHIGGFDSFIRCVYSRPTKPIHVWGPPATGDIVHHRLRGFLWNLVEEQRGVWFVHDVAPDHVAVARFESAEAFAPRHPEPSPPTAAPLLATAGYTLSALTMDHRTPSLAYILRERPHVNVDLARLAALGVAPGPWLQAIKAPPPDAPPTLEIGGAPRDLAALRRDLLVETPGQRFAYLTDFLLDDAAAARLTPELRDCDLIISECQYHDADADLARRHHHMRPALVADLARAAGAKDLILMHLSERYRPPVWREMLAAAQAIFPPAHFPDHWRLDA